MKSYENFIDSTGDILSKSVENAEDIGSKITLELTTEDGNFLPCIEEGKGYRLQIKGLKIDIEAVIDRTPIYRADGSLYIKQKKGITSLSVNEDSYWIGLEFLYVPPFLRKNIYKT